MGRRLPKDELLMEIDRERRALDDTLAVIPDRQMTEAGVTRGGWSVKDVLAHLIEWQRMNLDWFAAGQRGEKPAMPAPGFTLRELPRLNAMIYRKHHRRSLAAVKHDYRVYHERVVALITADGGALGSVEVGAIVLQPPASPHSCRRLTLAPQLVAAPPKPALRARSASAP